MLIDIYNAIDKLLKSYIYKKASSNQRKVSELISFDIRD
jgi:hypothetical protein